METNPYSSPREIASGDARHHTEPSGCRVVLKGIGIGALLGAAAGTLSVVTVLWISWNYQGSGGLMDTTAGRLLFFHLAVAYSATAGAVAGAFGFGMVAVGRRFRRRSQ